MKRAPFFLAIAASLLGGCQAGMGRTAAVPPLQGSVGRTEIYSVLDIVRTKPVLLVFCDNMDSRETETLIKDMSAIQDKLKGKVQVLGVATMDGFAADTYRAKNPDWIPVIPDPDGLFASRYEVKSVPTAHFIGKGGAPRQTWSPIPTDFSDQIAKLVELP